MNKRMKFNIQKFAEEADNAFDEDVIEIINEEVDNLPESNDKNSEEEDTETADSEESLEDIDEVEEKVSKTKAYSERLNKDRENIKNELKLELEREAQAKLDAIAKARNFDSWAELEEFDQTERITGMGIDDPNEFKKMINDLIVNNPIVQEAQKVLNKQKKEDQEVYIKTQISEINKLDNSIKTINDLVKLDKYDEFTEKLDKGYSLVDAYKLTYFDKIKNNVAEDTKQNVLTNLESKSHLKNTAGKGSKDVYVPDEVMATYKKNMPDMSEEEIRKHYSHAIEK